MAAIVKAVAGLPLRLARGPVGFVLLAFGIARKRTYSIAVAGLDETRAQPIWFALRRAATAAQEQATAERWLEALQLCQCANSLLLSELDEVEANLQFWHRQEQRGSHFWHSLLRRGPLQFAGQLATLLRLRPRHEGALGEADLVEKRVLIFRLLRSSLCEALAQVQAAAALLYLREGQGGGQDGELPLAEEGLFQRADRRAAASLAAVAAAFQQLQESARATLEGQQGPGGAPAQDWQVLQGALSRVLGVHHLTRVLSRWQLLQQQQGQHGQPQQEQQPVPAAGPQPAAQPAAGPLTSAVALHQARQAAGVSLALPAHATVHSALQAAHRTARSMRGRRLVQVPQWALMPSEYQQHWVRYSVILAAAGYGTLFLYKHSRLAGSRDLDDWLAQSVAAVRGAWREHVVAPLAGVQRELFNTFRRRPTVVSNEDFEAERESLARMLSDFERDFAGKQRNLTAAAGSAATSAAAAGSSNASLAPAGYSAQEEAQLQAGMDLVMRTYEREMQRPLKNLVGGQLVRTLLIQVQKLKLDTASAMLELDQILKANELSISLVAAVPAFLIAGTSLFYLGRVLTPTPPDPRREALPVRMSMIEVERALDHVAAAEEAKEAAEQRAGPGAAAEEEREAEAREKSGMFAYRLAVAYEEAKELFRRHRGLIAIGGSEWPNIRSDLLELASPGSVAQRRRTAQRMMRSYSIFQQF